MSVTATDLGSDTDAYVSNRSSVEDLATSPVSTRFESIWLSSPEQGPSERSFVDGPDNNYLEENDARFIVPPPKFSDPYPDEFQNSAPSIPAIPNRRQGSPVDIDNEGNNGTGSTDDIVREKIDDGTDLNSSKDSKPIFEDKRDGKRSQQGQNNNVKITHRVRRRSRHRRKQQILSETTCTDDETSIENYGFGCVMNSNTLQERSQQAWKSRQKKNSIARTKHDNGPNTSVGAPNRIHHFETQDQYEYRSKDKEDMSLDRSLNSMYTKTLESEVEDMIKDILFIGSPDKNKPGRRKYRHKPDVKRKAKKNGFPTITKDAGARSKARLGVLDETNIETGEDYPSSASESTSDVAKTRRGSSNVINSTKTTSESRPKHQSRHINAGDDKSSLASTISRASSVDSNTVETFLSEKDTMDDPVNAIIGLVEGGLSIMSSAIGYALENYTQEGDKESAIDKSKKTQGDYDIFESCGIAMGDQNMITDASGQRRIGMGGTSSKKDLTGFPENANLTTAKNKLLGSKHSEENPDTDTNAAEEHERSLIVGTQNKVNRRPLGVERSPELPKLALHAARSVHRLQGVAYDNSIPIDMYKEVKICPVTLKLPLGIIFLENDGGCFVTKVSPDGSAALSRRVELGDQLASINGISSIKMKVDDICDVVRYSPNPSEIKLIFLRYIGPLRPLAKNSKTENKACEIDDVRHYIMNTDREPSSSPNKKTSRTVKSHETKKPTKKKGGFRLFGRGKNNSDEKGVRSRGNVN
ncbi:unnamed protein product [Pseudo-nitzschia multistriata]|uniref:PDZ domain-containing protein n=1 Tax=Pseudo-nitzschia multistriata TaxID=183589 RepID=A0A448ZLY5_9STRA|nr:unnamed protein product [Pseudo-nitzschia multistriata]